MADRDVDRERVTALLEMLDFCRCAVFVDKTETNLEYSHAVQAREHIRLAIRRLVKLEQARRRRAAQHGGDDRG